MAIFICVAFLYAGIKIYFFKKRNPSFEPEAAGVKHLENYGLGTTMFKFAIYFSDALGEYLFWTLFGSSFIIFTNYKQTMMVTLTLPELGHGSEGFYSTAYAIFMMALIFRQLSVLLHIWEQSTTDIYMIDHEQPSLT